MSEERLQQTLNDLGVPDYVSTTEERLIARLLASETVDEIEQVFPERLPRIAIVYENQGIALYQRWTTMLENTEVLQTGREAFSRAFTCWRSLSTLNLNSNDREGSDVPVSSDGLDMVKPLINEELAPAELQLAFRIGISGTIANRIAETRLELTRFELPDIDSTSTWRDRVIYSLLASVIRLIRKSNGWGDINEAVRLIEELRQLQVEYEETYVDSVEDKGEQTLRAVELVGLYHLAQLLTLTGEYLQDGNPPVLRLRTQLNTQLDRAKTALDAAKSSDLSYISTLLWAGCFELIQNAIWTHVAGRGAAMQTFARLLADKGKAKPVIELWPSQQQAFGKQLFDTSPRAILVEMPTSAGKTLLAKFLIVQTKTLYPDGTIAYVVPTRALVNQVTAELRRDFRGFQQHGLKVEQAVPVFELDPTEEELLKTRPDILVTTPEKLDLLIKSDHEAVQDLSFVIADEAHNIADGGRGARLELLLGTIKRERPDARFLMLSPFLPNGDELVRWLGEDRYLPPIQVDWKPSLKILGTILPEGRASKRKLMFQTLPAANNAVRSLISFPVGSAVGVDRTVTKVTVASVSALLDRGSILVLCWGPGTSEEYAAQIASTRPQRPLSPKAEAICRYLEAEFGFNAPLVDHIKRGVAYHHSGLSHEARWLIESLISDGTVNVICGTTTLAQGMNFPISTVLITTLRKGQDSTLSHNDFWNIAGRAGRALVDSIGIVGFPIKEDSAYENRKEFLKKDAEIIASQISKLFDEAGNLVEEFQYNQLNEIRQYPELAALMQFLAHAMRVSGSSQIADELEDWLRSSLIFYQTQRENPVAARALINLCRAYLASIRAQSSILGLADQTGFATPSVLALLARAGNKRIEFEDPDKWLPERLFGNDIDPMRERIEAIADLPEIDLGQGIDAQFNPELVARIIKDWVLGKNLNELAQEYWMEQETNDKKRLTKFSQYLFKLIGKVSWGIGALETVSLSGTKDIDENVGHIPFMIFYGVRQKEAIWLRMVGVPRIVADGLSETWRLKQTQSPQNYDDIRSWVSGLTDTDWLDVIPINTSLTPEDMRVIWSEFSG